jgi:hypothetical protein
VKIKGKKTQKIRIYLRVEDKKYIETEKSFSS